MDALKKILKSDGMKVVIGWIAAFYIWLVYRTCRWQVLNGEIPTSLMREGKPIIMAFWHGRLLMMPLTVSRKTKVSVMISHHGDGEIIAKTVKHWGIDSIRGSSTKGALPAIKEMLRKIKRNEVVAITPDGPGGPRMRVKEGVVRIAAMSGVPVYPVTASTSRGKTLKSWDRFFVAKPFGRGVIIWGDPIIVPRSDENGAHDKARLEIENSLNDLTHRADELSHQPKVEPDDVSALPKKHKKAS